MQLSKSLFGALIGGALGIGLLIAVHLLGIKDYSWLAIPVAVLTGVGVRWMVDTKGHPSYARGALTGVLALAAFVVGNYLVAQVATRRAIAAQGPAQIAQGTEEQKVDDEANAGSIDVPIQPVDTTSSERLALNGPDARMRVPAKPSSMMDYVWLSVAALVAYELGRGTGASAPRDENEIDSHSGADGPVVDA